MADIPKPTKADAHQGITDLLKIFNGIIECRECKGRKKRPQPCRDLRRHFGIHFFHIENLLKAVKHHAEES